MQYMIDQLAKERIEKDRLVQQYKMQIELLQEEMKRQQHKYHKEKKKMKHKLHKAIKIIESYKNKQVSYTSRTDLDNGHLKNQRNHSEKPKSNYKIDQTPDQNVRRLQQNQENRMLYYSSAGQLHDNFQHTPDSVNTTVRRDRSSYQTSQSNTRPTTQRIVPDFHLDSTPIRDRYQDPLKELSNLKVQINDVAKSMECARDVKKTGDNLKQHEERVKTIEQTLRHKYFSPTMDDYQWLESQKQQFQNVPQSHRDQFSNQLDKMRQLKAVEINTSISNTHRSNQVDSKQTIESNGQTKDTGLTERKVLKMLQERVRSQRDSTQSQKRSDSSQSTKRQPIQLNKLDQISLSNPTIISSRPSARPPISSGRMEAGEQMRKVDQSLNYHSFLLGSPGRVALPTYRLDNSRRSSLADEKKVSFV